MEINIYNCSGVQKSLMSSDYTSFDDIGRTKLRKMEKSLADSLELNTLTPIEKMKISKRLLNIRNILNLIRGI